MATKTKPDPTTALEQLQGKADEAAAEVADIGRRHADAAGLVDRLRGERLGMQVEHPEWFSDDGVKPGTPAQEMTTRLLDAVKAIEQGDFTARREAAEERSRRAADAVTRYRGANARALLEALRAPAMAAVADFHDWASEGGALLQRITHVQAEASAICTRSGLASPRDIPGYDHASRLVRDLEAAVLPLPMPRSMELDS